MSSAALIDILFLVCEPRIARELTEEIMDRLNKWNVPARVLKYGIMQKGINGFLVIAVQGLPNDLLEIIKQDSEVSGFVILENNMPATMGTEAQV